MQRLGTLKKINTYVNVEGVHISDWSKVVYGK